MTANPLWFNTNHGIKVAEYHLVLVERRTPREQELFFLWSWILQHAVNQKDAQPLPILAYLQATFSLVNSVRFSEGSLSRKFIFFVVFSDGTASQYGIRILQVKTLNAEILFFQRFSCLCDWMVLRVVELQKCQNKRANGDNNAKNMSFWLTFSKESHKKFVI